MIEKKCLGCGVRLQCEDEKKPGFIPEEVLMTKNEIICKRCFHIKNYGKNILLQISDEEYMKQVKRILNEVDLILYVIDIIDFEGSFDYKIIDLISEKNVLVAVNKIDLIPSKKHATETSNWVKTRLIEESIFPKDIAMMSVKTGYGVNGIIRKINNLYPDGSKVAVIGVTNVGKSTLINAFFGDKKKLTVSKYPGTTLETVRNKIPHTKITIIDTPGVIPNGRISDMVCEECAVSMVPSKEIARKTYKLGKDRVLLFGKLVKIRIMSDNEFDPIFAAFASKDIQFHETNDSKADEILADDKKDFLSPPCKKCIDDYRKLTLKKEIITLEEGEELVFKGLGWISVRRGPLEIEVTLPEEAELVVREALISPKI